MNAKGPVRVRIIIEVHPCEEDVEIDRAEWDAMTPRERREWLDEAGLVAVGNAGGYGWHIEDPADLAQTEG